MMSDDASYDTWHLVGETGAFGEDEDRIQDSNVEVKPTAMERRNIFGLGIEDLQNFIRGSPPAPNTPQQHSYNAPTVPSPVKAKVAQPAPVQTVYEFQTPPLETSPPEGKPSKGSQTLLVDHPIEEVREGPPPPSAEEKHPLSPSLFTPGLHTSSMMEGPPALMSVMDSDSDGEEDVAEEDRDWRDIAQLERDIRQACLGAPPARLHSTTRFCKVLLVGEKGLGKSTMLRNLAAGFSPASVKWGVVEGDSTAAFLDEPHRLCTDICIPDPAGGNNFHYLLQDTPGLNTPEDVEVVVDYVRAQLHAYVSTEEDPERGQPMSRLADPRVDVALYFIAPHALKPQDIDAMARLSLLVPIVPLLAKADAMTAGELAEFREEVRSALQAASVALGRPIMHDFGAGAAASAGALRSVPPFAVVGAAAADLSVGPNWPVRVYPWGKVEALSSSHSDLLALRKLLFEAAFEELKSGTEKRYYAFRQEKLAQRPWAAWAARVAIASPWAKAGPQDDNSPKTAVAPRPLTEARRGGRKLGPSRSWSWATGIKWGIIGLTAAFIFSHKMWPRELRVQSTRVQHRDLLNLAELIRGLESDLKRSLELSTEATISLWR